VAKPQPNPTANILSILRKCIRSDGRVESFARDFLCQLIFRATIALLINGLPNI